MSKKKMECLKMMHHRRQHHHRTCDPSSDCCKQHWGWMKGMEMFQSKDLSSLENIECSI